jgi:hypothetical protein
MWQRRFGVAYSKSLLKLRNSTQIDIGKIDFSVFKLVWSQKSLVMRDKLAFLLGSTELWYARGPRLLDTPSPCTAPQLAQAV